MCTGAAVLRALHEAGADVLGNCHASNGKSNGRTPLFCAALGGHLGALEFLIELAQYTGRIDVVNTADANGGQLTCAMRYML
jgi:Ankyrin repeats (many copies)